MANFELGEQASVRFLSLSPEESPCCGMLAERTGLEPATPGVTGRYSNRLNYHSLNLQYTCLVGADGIEPPTFAV